MKLYLVQHGQATPKEVNPERPLTVKGTEDIKKTALFLKQAGIKITNIFHSNKKRAQQTAAILAEEAGLNCNIIEKDTLAPLDSIDIIHQEISVQTEDLLLVGHLPFLGKLASKLLLNAEDASIIEFQQGCVLILEKKEQTWKITALITADMLP